MPYPTVNIKCTKRVQTESGLIINYNKLENRMIIML